MTTDKYNTDKYNTSLTNKIRKETRV